METLNFKRILGLSAAVLALIGGVAYVGYRIQRQTPGTAAWRRAEGRARRDIAAWSENSRRLAEVMLERYGPPDVTTEESLAWSGPYPWKRIVVHRLHSESPLEHVAAYDVPPEKLEQVRALGHGISVDPWNGELSARSDREALNFLALNLADQIVNGTRSPEDARAFYVKTAVLSLSGKSSPYMEGPMFKPRPRRARYSNGRGYDY